MIFFVRVDEKQQRRKFIGGANGSVFPMTAPREDTFRTVWGDQAASKNACSAADWSSAGVNGLGT